MNVVFSTKSLENIFQLQQKLSHDSYRSLQINFFEGADRISAHLRVYDLSIIEISRHLDPMMLESFWITDEEIVHPEETNVFRFRAESVDLVKEWLRRLPRHQVKCIVIQFSNGYPDVEVRVCMADAIRLHDLRNSLKTVRDGRTMALSVQRSQHYTGELLALPGDPEEHVTVIDPVLGGYWMFGHLPLHVVRTYEIWSFRTEETSPYVAVLVAELSDGTKMYCEKGGITVCETYDDIVAGTDIDTIEDVDFRDVDQPVNTLDDLLKVLQEENDSDY